MHIRQWLCSAICAGVLFVQTAGGCAAADAIIPLDIRGAANTAFQDETAEDRQGGWTDDGGNDLRVIKPGRLDGGGVPFAVLSDEETGGKSCIVLGGKPRAYLPQKAVLTLPENAGGRYLYLLHAAAWSGKDGNVVGTISAAFADGATKSFQVCTGRDVGDWWSRDGGVNAIRVWSAYNNNSQVSLFVSRFDLGGRPVKSLEFAADNAAWMIAAASMGEYAMPAALKSGAVLNREYPAPETEDAAALAAAPRTGTPRNIIMIIGDGMGLGAMHTASLHAHGMPGRLVMEQLPITGIVRTYSANSKVTDSAASGTALSSGYKTNNSFLGMTPEKIAKVTIAEAAHKAGKSVGLLTTDSLTGATPAAYSAHVPSRSMSDEIAAQQANSGFEVLLGVNPGPFLPAAEKGTRKDGRNLFAEMQKKGYLLTNSLEEVEKAPAGKITGAIRDWSDITLLGRVAAGVFRRLNANPKGFFVMVEGSWPDSGGHSNNPDKSVSGTLMVDFAAKAALEFAKENPDTLIVITADHETGGMVSVPNRFAPKKPLIFYNDTNHTGAPVGIFAYGPGADEFSGVIENTYIPAVFAKLWQLQLGADVGE